MPPDPRSDPRAAAAAAAQRSGSSGSSSSSKDPRASSSSSSPKDPRASSSSSSKDPRADPRASSSSSSKDPRASSSSSGSSSSGGSSSSSSSKPAVKTPEISANQWMSFFLFVCLCLIILQGPLGLTTPAVGNATAAGWSEWLSFPSWGTGGAMPGCGAGVVMLPWCAAPMAVQPAAAPALGPAPAPAMGQMGGQGGFAMPGGGGGWSWYSNPPGQGQAQQMNPMAPQQIINVQGGMPIPPEYYAQPPPYAYAPPQQPNEGLCWYMPYLCQPLIPGAYAYSPPAPPRRNYVRAANGMIYEQPDRVVQLAQKAPAYNPYPYAAPYPYPYPPHYHASQPAYAPPPEPVRQLRPMPPVRRVGSMPVVHDPPHAPPPPVAAPPIAQTIAESPGLANLENAFYPLLVGAIALLVVFDYAT